MTAPDDVRARFEAWHDAKWPPPNPGEPYHWRAAWSSAKRDRLAIWQAAHADRDAEVRELVEAATEIADNTESWNRAVIEIIGRQPNTGIGTERLRAALAKFTQEKP